MTIFDFIKRRRFIILVLGLVALSCIWILIYEYAPIIIKDAYYGRSFHFINGFIKGQNVHSLDFYLGKWNALNLATLKGVLTLSVLLIPLFVNFSGIGKAIGGKDDRIFHQATGIPLLAVTLLIFIFILYYYNPVGYIHLISEDNWGEYGTFVCYLTGFLILLKTICKNKNMRKPGYFLFFLSLFIIAMEEISWGQRFFSFHSGEFFNAYNIQHETNLHNFLPPTPYRAAGIVIFLGTIIIPLLANQVGKMRDLLNKFGIPIVPPHLWPCFLITTFFLVFFPIHSSDEIAELFLGLSLMLLAMDISISRDQGALRSHRISPLITVGVMLYISFASLNLTFFYGNPNAFKVRLNQYASSRLVHTGNFRQAEKIFEYLNRNPRLLMNDTHMHQGLFLQNTEKYEEARKILLMAIKEQERQRKLYPEEPQFDRNLGTIYATLGESHEAGVEYGKAIKKDEIRLKKAKNQKDLVKINKSLGKSYLAMGRKKEALSYLNRARLYCYDKRTKYYIEKLIRQMGN